MLTKIKNEVMSRDLSDVPTDKLLDLFLKYNNQIREEIVEPIYKSSQELIEERQDRELLEELTTLQSEPLTTKLCIKSYRGNGFRGEATKHRKHFKKWLKKI